MAKASARPASRRRSRPSLRTRVRTFWLLAAIVGLAAGYGTYRAIAWPGFRLSHLDVTGLHVVERAEVVRRAGLDPHANVWLLNLRAATRRIEAIPYVRSAYVRRIVPARVAIDIVERTPDGCVTTVAGSLLIDADRRVLASDCAARPEPRYRLTGEPPATPGAFLHDARLAHLQSDAHQLTHDGVALAALEHDRFGDLDATLRSGIRVLLGAESDLDQKAALLGPILQTLQKYSRPIETVDLRAPATPVVVYRH